MSLLYALLVIKTVQRKSRVSLKTRAVRRNLATGQSWKLAPLLATCSPQQDREWDLRGTQPRGNRGSSPRGGSIPQGWVPCSLHDFWLQMSKKSSHHKGPMLDCSHQLGQGDGGPPVGSGLQPHPRGLVPADPTAFPMWSHRGPRPL